MKLRFERLDVCLKLLPRDWQFYNIVDSEPRRLRIMFGFIFLHIRITVRKKR